MRTIGIPLYFSDTNITSYNITAARLTGIRRVRVRQVTVHSYDGSTPPVPNCFILSDIISSDQVLCSVPLDADTASHTTCLDTPVETSMATISGIHTFTLGYTPADSYDWTGFEASILLVLEFE